MDRLIEVRNVSITDTGAAAVVNASNEKARLGGGVSRALFLECGGPVLQDEMTAKLIEYFDGVLGLGDCLVTSGGTSTKVRYILHVAAVDYTGPRARLGASGVERTVTSEARVQECTVSALRAAADLANTEATAISVAMPILGAGSGGMSVAAAINAIITGIRLFFSEEPNAKIGDIVFAVPEPDRFEICSKLVKSAFG